MTYKIKEYFLLILPVLFVFVFYITRIYYYLIIAEYLALLPFIFLSKEVDLNHIYNIQKPLMFFSLMPLIIFSIYTISGILIPHMNLFGGGLIFFFSQLFICILIPVLALFMIKRAKKVFNEQKDE